MNTTWILGQFELHFYQAFVLLLVWLLAMLACFGVLVSVLLLCQRASASERRCLRSAKARRDRDAAG